MAQFVSAIGWCVPLYVSLTRASALNVLTGLDIGTGALAAALGTAIACVTAEFCVDSVCDFMQLLRVCQYGLLFVLWSLGIASDAAAVVHGFTMYALYTVGDALYQMRSGAVLTQLANSLHHSATLYLLSLCASLHLPNLGACILVVYSLSTLPLSLRKLLRNYTGAAWSRVKTLNDVALVMLWTCVRMPVTLAYTQQVYAAHGAQFVGFQLLLLLNCMNAVWFSFILRGARAKLRLGRDSKQHVE